MSTSSGSGVGGTFTFFPVAGKLGSGGLEKEVDANGDPVRKRVQHRKSRFGCGNCKSRKVKCDETRPSCMNCQRRGLQCTILGGRKPNERPASEKVPTYKDASQQCSLPPLAEQYANWNINPNAEQKEYLRSTLPPSLPSSIPLEYAFSQTSISIDRHLESSSPSARTATPPSTVSDSLEIMLKLGPNERSLLRHFELHSASTLAISPSMWEGKVLSIAVQHDYVMSAVLVIAASHINHYLPPSSPSYRPVLRYFVDAISGLRHAINEGINMTNMDAVISCSLLLMQYGWTYMDVNARSRSDVFHLFYEVLPIFDGLKSCIVAGQMIFMHKGFMARVLEHRPRETLEEYIRLHKDIVDPFMEAIHHTVFCGLNSYHPDCSSPDNLNSLTRLSTVLAAIKIARPNIEVSGLAEDIERFLFTWPPFCTKGFHELVYKGNETSLVVLFYYYAAILGSLSSRTWWMRDRAVFQFGVLRGIVEGRCGECAAVGVDLAGDLGEGVGVPGWVGGEC